MIGLAGLDRPVDEAIWREAIAKLPSPFPPELTFTNDAELILSVHPERVGLGLICGTGSIVVGRDKAGNKGRAGGWGHFFGDEGSGLWFGREALRAAAHSADGRGPQTLLLELILREWNLAQPDELIGQVYVSPRPDNARIARLAGVVFTAAEAGDKVASQLVEIAAQELAQAVQATYHKLVFAEPPALAIAGGVLLSSNLLYQRFEDVLRTNLKSGKFIKVPDPALAAAVALAYEWRTLYAKFT
jgi:N-acetylglucosamine kinase-like BadF-type ATPase